MRKALFMLLFIPVAATAGLVVEDEGTKTAVVVPDRPAAPIVVAVEIWRGEKGGTLRSELQRWADRAHWILIWNAKKGPDEVNYGLPAPIEFEGTFDQAVAAWIKRYERARIPLYVDIQPSQKVVYVTAEEN